MPRIVFLDIDGVLATARTYQGAPFIRVPVPWGEPETVWTDPRGLLDPKLAANVEALCEAAGAGLVVSSDWRRAHDLETLAGWFASVGLTAPLLGATPILGPPRGAEIQRVVESMGLEPADFLILEDVEDVRPYRGRQIQTTFNGPRPGFTERHLRRALRAWGLGPPGRMRVRRG